MEVSNRTTARGVALVRFLAIRSSAACLLLGCALVLAEELDAEYHADSVRFSIAEVPPWGYVDQQGDPAGLLVELVRAIADQLSEPIEYRLRPTPRTISELRHGDADFSVLFDAPAVQVVGERLAEVVRMRVLVLGLSDQPAVDELDALHGRHVGFIRGAWYGQAFHAHEGLNTVPVSDAEHGFRLLEKDRIQALVVTEFAASAGLNRQMAEQLVILLELPEVTGSVYQSHRSHQRELAPQMREVILGLRESGRLEQIFARPEWLFGD